jgi:hypothetical protein
MGTSLSGLTPSATYTGLLKFGDNAAISGTLKAISDGAGTDTMLSLSTTALQIGGATGLNWDNTNKRLGIGTNAPTTALEISAPLTSIIYLRNGGTNFITTRTSGIGESDIGFRIWNNANNTTLDLYGSGSYDSAKHRFCVGGGSYERLLIGASTSATITGSGSTSATTSLLVKNSAAASAFQVFDNGQIYMPQSGGTSLYLDRIKAFTAADISMPLFIVGAGTLNGSAAVQINATDRGFLPPRMTTTQRNAITSPAEGLMIYNTTTAKLNVFTTAWEAITSI